jgi:hypothetical protein
MSNRFASGKYAIAECDICSFRYMLSDLKPVIVKTKNVNLLACPECWDPDHPQLLLGMFPVEDPEAIMNPRRDNSYYNIGNDGSEGSRVVQWGWNPVGGSRNYDRVLTPNALIGISIVNSVTIVSSTPPIPPIPPIPPNNPTLVITETGNLWITETGIAVSIL